MKRLMAVAATGAGLMVGSAQADGFDEGFELGVRKKSRYDSVGKRLKRLPSAYAEHSETFSALNYVGNIGSHGEDVTRQVLINSFQLFEYMLEELYGGRKEKMQQIAKSLIETKGRGK